MEPEIKLLTKVYQTVGLQLGPTRARRQLVESSCQVLDVVDVLDDWRLVIEFRKLLDPIGAWLVFLLLPVAELQIIKAG